MTVEITDDALAIKNIDHIVDEMHLIFTKNQNVKKHHIVEDFISSKRKIL